jgi:ribonucleoside-diphosphate reductase alpha chain
MFSRNKISGKYLEVNPNLVEALKKEGLWEKVSGTILENHGDISEIDAIPERIKKIYKTSFAVSAYAFIEVAARAQKWVDQAISRNMYLETRDIDEIMNIYKSAWEKGLKTTYYLHMKPRHTAEQSTTRVNKAETIGKKGFAALRTKAVETPVEAVTPTEPVPSPVEMPVMAEAVVAQVDTVAVPQTAKPKFTVHLSDDPADANICEGCE